MDQKQKDVLNSVASKLASAIDFNEIAEYLQLAKLVTEEQVQNIVIDVESNFCRNIKLFDAIQESKSEDAFNEFTKVLEITQNQDALNIIKSVVKAKESPSGARSIWRKLADITTGQSKNYSIGMNSGRSCTTSSHYSGSSMTKSDSTTLSPLKEKRQATLVRPQELALINNLNISDQDHGDQSVSTTASTTTSVEPIVCWHPYAQSQSASSPSATGTSPHLCNFSVASLSSESDTSSDSLMIDPTVILDSNVTMAIAREGPNMMSVKLASICHANPEEDYKMTARPRGPCLIINNIDFEGEIFPTRKGSDEDARRFDDIFQQLGFTVIMRRNQTADQMRKLFKEVASECKLEHDALFVFILSHGSEHGIYGTDGMEVYLESEIISCFDNRNCKAMLGKPKVFVIQACRGRAKDCGGDGDTTDSIAWTPVAENTLVKSASQEYRVPTSWLPNQILDGFVSVRNELAGSWLGVALAYFIMTHAHERDLLRILNLVTSDVIQRESSNGHIQSIELKLLGWTKNLYFNPGIYI